VESESDRDGRLRKSDRVRLCGLNYNIDIPIRVASNETRPTVRFDRLIVSSKSLVFAHSCSLHRGRGGSDQN
jgi:hypothetical protein